MEENNIVNHFSNGLRILNTDSEHRNYTPGKDTPLLN